MKHRAPTSRAGSGRPLLLIEKTILLRKPKHRSKKGYFAIGSPSHEDGQYYCDVFMPSGSHHRIAGIEPLQAILNGVRFIVVDLSQSESRGWRVYSPDGKRRIKWRPFFHIAALEARDERKPNKAVNPTPGNAPRKSGRSSEG